jgi:hypothetical protein
MVTDQIPQIGEYGTEALRKLALPRSDNAVCHAFRAVAMNFDNAIPREARAGINAQDAHAAVPAYS